jgi:hypothetical protein
MKAEREEMSRCSSLQRETIFKQVELANTYKWGGHHNTHCGHYCNGERGMIMEEGVYCQAEQGQTECSKQATAKKKNWLRASGDLK